MRGYTEREGGRGSGCQRICKGLGGNPFKFSCQWLMALLKEAGEMWAWCSLDRSTRSWILAGQRLKSFGRSSTSAKATPWICHSYCVQHLPWPLWPLLWVLEIMTQACNMPGTPYMPSRYPLLYMPFDRQGTRPKRPRKLWTRQPISRETSLDLPESEVCVLFTAQVWFIL